MKRTGYDQLHIDVCIDCMIYLASGLTPPEHQAEWSLTAIAERWEPERVLVLRDEDDHSGSWTTPCEMCGRAPSAKRGRGSRPCSVGGLGGILEGVLSRLS